MAKPLITSTSKLRAQPMVRKPKHVVVVRKSRHDKTRLRAVVVGEGVPPIPVMQEELRNYWDVLLGRVTPPIDSGIMTLQEVSNAYFTRGMEMTFLLQQAEREGTITRGSAHYKFRTGELRTFCDAAKYASDLGSRRLTAEELEFRRATYGRESAGDF